MLACGGFMHILACSANDSVDPVNSMDGGAKEAPVAKAEPKAAEDPVPVRD